MIISKIDSQYIRTCVVPHVTFENIGKPCSLPNCVQVASIDIARNMWNDINAHAVDNHVWSCMVGSFSQYPEKVAACDREIADMEVLLQKTFSNNPVVQSFARNHIEFNVMTGSLLAASLEWLAYGNDPKHVWFRSMIPILLAGHLVCGFAGKKKKLHFGYRPEPVYYVY